MNGQCKPSNRICAWWFLHSWTDPQMANFKILHPRLWSFLSSNLLYQILCFKIQYCTDQTEGESTVILLILPLFLLTAFYYLWVKGVKKLNTLTWLCLHTKYSDYRFYFLMMFPKVHIHILLEIYHIELECNSLGIEAMILYFIFFGIVSKLVGCWWNWWELHLAHSIFSLVYICIFICYSQDLKTEMLITD